MTAGQKCILVLYENYKNDIFIFVRMQCRDIGGTDLYNLNKEIWRTAALQSDAFLNAKEPDEQKRLLYLHAARCIWEWKRDT